MNELNTAFGAMFEVSVKTDGPISYSLVQSSVPILTAPVNPLTEPVHVRTGGKQGFNDCDSAEVPTPGGIDQLAIKDTRVATKTGRSQEDEHKDNGGETCHRFSMKWRLFG